MHAYVSSIFLLWFYMITLALKHLQTHLSFTHKGFQFWLHTPSLYKYVKTIIIALIIYASTY